MGVNTDGSQNGQEPNERMEAAAAQTTEGDERKPREVFKESEELFSGEESPSLFHTHSSAFGQNEERDVEEKVIQVGPDQTDKEIKLSVEAQQETQPLLLACKSVLRREESKLEGKQTERKKAEMEQSEDGQRDGCLQRGTRNVDMVVEDGKECEKGDDDNKVKEDQINVDQGDRDTKGVGLLESCTLVEGLLFPAEYYVRTTRRMTSSHSQPDMQAVILSQLNIGRHRRRRGNGRGLTHSGGSNSQTSDSVGPCSKSKEADMSDETNRQSSSKNSGQVPDGQIKKDACFSAANSTSRPARGQKRRRGRGRGRCSFSPVTRPQGLEHTSDNPQLTNSPVLLSPSPYRTTVSPCPLPCSADEPKSFLTSPVPDDKQHLITPSSAPEHVAGMTGTKDSPASGQNSRNRSSQLSGSKTCFNTDCYSIKSYFLLHELQ